mgnify:CR=1 FL=1
MNTKAVVDRFEGQKAVILVGDEEEQLVVDRKKLPVGTKEGHWLRVEVRDDVLIAAEFDEAETARTKERIAAKLSRLRKGEHRSC